MRIHEATTGQLMDLVAAWIGRESDPQARNQLWERFLSELHRRMRMWCDNTPSPKSIGPAMEEIGFVLSDFIEPTTVV